MELLTAKETTQRLHITKGQLSKIVNGKVRGIHPIPHVRIGRRHLFRKDALEQWIMDQERNARGEQPLSGQAENAARVA